MTVTQILAALEQISKRSDTVYTEIDLAARQGSIGAVGLATLATQVSEIGRLAALTRDMIEMEGLQLLTHGESPIATVLRNIEELRAEAEILTGNAELSGP